MLGGDCLHFGCVPSKTLIKSARIYHYMKKAGDYGLPGIEVPRVDFSQNNQGVQRIRAGKLLMAAGRDPNVKGLGLESIGVKTNRGVVADQRLRTSQKNIFAAGDVTGTYQFTHAAGYEGGIVVANAVFRLPRRVDYTWLP